MRRFILAAAMVAISGPAAAEIYEFDTARSLSEIESALSSRAALSEPEKFALGATQFLRAIETSLQTRYKSNAALGSEWIEVPLLRLPFEPNPDPEPFRPELIREVFQSLIDDMSVARNTLEGAQLNEDDGVRVNVSDLWFDIDSDGQRDPGEALVDVIAGTLAAPQFLDLPPSGDAFEIAVLFDAADVEWFVAYTHFLSGIGEFVIAFDPTESIERMIDSKTRMRELRGFDTAPGYVFGGDDEAFADAFATIYEALNRRPDQPRLAAARNHFLGMIAANRDFWELAGRETDNENEWIPNDRQTAALGFTLPPNTRRVWLDVLSDAEAVLNGELLVGHWRLGYTEGINVARLVEDPPAVDIVTWLQGQGLVDYMEKGTLVEWSSFVRFMTMFRGQALLFMVLLN